MTYLRRFRRYAVFAAAVAVTLPVPAQLSLVIGTGGEATLVEFDNLRVFHW